MSAFKRPWPSRASLTIALVGLTVLCSGAAFAFRNDLQRLGEFGYLGAFGVAVAGNAVVAAPFPWLLMVAPLGVSYSHPWLVLAAASGAVLGALLPYAFGLRVAEHSRHNRWVERLSAMAGWKKTLVVIALSFSPVLSYPTLAAGLVRYPLLITLGIVLITEGVKVWLALEATTLGLRVFG